MNKFRLASFVISLCMFMACSLVIAAPRVDFTRDVMPILQKRCFSCHGPDEQEAKLRLDARALVFHGGVSGPSVVRGNAKESLLYQRIIEGADDRMPLDEEPLTSQQIELIRHWIDQGAKWPDGVGANVKAPDQHWAYIRPSRAPLPVTRNAHWATTPIDVYVIARLQKEGLEPSSRANRAKLLRRTSLDLVGLPPSFDQLEEFLTDDNPDALDRAVDRLLASPMYGTKWARGWLDLARYADSNGYQADQYRNVWPYRDWVINAMNADMPFDQFTIEQLAGDLLPNATIEQKIATGFHRLTTCNVEAGVDPEENRVNQIIDRVNTTGTVWLGTSIECMQCHSHKYDPFSQKEYYQLFAYYNNTPLEVEGNGVTYNFVGPKMNLPLDKLQITERRELQAQFKSANDELKSLIASRKNQQAAWEKQTIAAQGESPKWHVLKADLFNSRGGAAHEILDDNSVLVSGKRPDNDFYTVTVTTKLAGITGFKVETLTDDSLPGKGPGRHDPARPNFVLHEFAVTASNSAGGTSQVVSLHSAQANYSQKQYAIAGAIDGNSDTGWAIHAEFGKPHWATFLASEPLGDGSSTKLTFTFDQHHGGCRTIGRLRLSAMTGNPGKSPLPEAIAKILALAAKKRTKKQIQQLEDYYIGLDPQIKKVRGRIAAIQKQLDAIKPATTLVMIEQDKARMTSLFKRGEFLNEGEQVRAGTPRVLHPQSNERPSNRIGLAQWLVAPDNPLVGRVTVNRWWADMLGRGIVATLEDFGTQGERPTHPDVLDWLACEFTESPQPWSMKQIHRQIVNSATYQQSARVSPELLARDPNNLLYARGPRFRLAAETVRDNALTVSGLLSTNMSGNPIYPPQPDGHWRHVGRNAPKYNTSQGDNRYRRGIYIVWRRSAPYPSFTNFDAPDRASCVVKRPRTNTATQALTLLNDPAYIEMALAFARRMALDHTNLTIQQKIQYGFRLATARFPKASEIEHVEGVYLRELARFEKSADSAKQLIGRWSGDASDSELAAWFYVANILLNLDETITKG